MAVDSWKPLLLGDVITLQRGFDLPSRLRKPGEIPIVSSSGVTDTHNQSPISGPGVVTGRYGTIGEVFFLEGDFWPLNTTLFVSDFKGNNPLFIYFLLKTIDYKIYSGKSGVPGVNRNDLHEIFVKLPPLEEQRSLVQALSDVDALIAVLDKLIAKKRNLKAATMQQLLTGKKRLPGFGEGQGYKESAIGLIPEDWSALTLAEIGQSLIGLIYKPENTRDHGTLVLRSSNIQNDRLTYEDNVYIDSSFPLPARVMVEKGDILICVRNGSRQLIGKCVLIDSATVGSAFGAFMSVFRTKLSDFVFYQFQSNVIKKQINETMGATINQITNKDMAAFQIPLPPSEEEQRAIATVLSDIDTEIAALESRLAKTQAIKQGMMQELLTGRTRLI